MEKVLKLLEYNFWANDLFILRLKEQKPIATPIREQMSHLLSAHRTWLDRIAGNKQRPPSSDQVEPALWEEMNIELYNETTDVVKTIPLHQTIRYKNSSGRLFEQELHDLLHHLVNHSTHHRAQIALLMRQHRVLPPKSDYIYYLRSI